MKNQIACFVLAGLALCVSETAEARGRWRRSHTSASTSYSYPANPRLTMADVEDGLDIVNARRQQHGLRPFRRDDRLFPRAAAQALRQARGGFMGHQGCDLSDGATEGVGTATTGGGGWNSCCWLENYTFAGAAYCEVNGTRYCCIHVR